jgi:hypothetical protein
MKLPEGDLQVLVYYIMPFQLVIHILPPNFRECL